MSKLSSLIDPQQPWHHWEIERVVAELQSELGGLSYVTARQRLRQYGANKLPRRRTYSRILLQPLLNPITYISIAIAILVYYLGSAIDGWALLTVCGLNALLGIGLNWWAIQTREGGSLGRPQRRQNVPSTEAIVLRDREQMHIPARDLVVGDVVMLEEGDRPSVDIRLFSASHLQVNQTEIGGAAIAPKQADAVLEPDTPMLERSNLVFAGTEVTTGSGVGVVFATGKSAYWQASSVYQQTFSAMHVQLNRLRRLWVMSVGLVVAAIALYAIAQGVNVVAIATVAASTLVGAYPQQLLRLATQAQLLGMTVLAKKRLWAKFPSALDALGRTTVITLVMESDTALETEELEHAGISWHGLIRASATDAESLGNVMHMKLFSYLDSPGEQMRSWQAAEQTVAMLATDPDDIPLLRQADVGITDRGCKKVVQDSCGLILPKEEPQYIAGAIAEGRAAIDKLQRLMLLLLTGTGAIVALVAAATFTDNLITAIVPLQILWTGAIATPLVAFPLIVEPIAASIMNQPAYRFQTIFRRGNYVRLSIAVLTVAATVMIVFWLKYQGLSSALTQARTMAFTTLVFSQVFHAFSLCRRSLVKNMALTIALCAVAIAQLAIVQVPAVGDLFDTVPLDYIEWAIAVLAATPVFWLQEFFRTS
jgi:magnesium-transporting ATPase (P-type)